MNTQYNMLADAMLDKIRSLGIPNITEEEAREMILSHLNYACVRFKACKQNLNNRDDILGEFSFELTYEEVEILVLLMFVEYLSANFIAVPSLLRQNLVSKDFKVFSSAEMILRLTDLKKTYVNEVNQMISTYSYTNSDLFNNVQK